MCAKNTFLLTTFLLLSVLSFSSLAQPIYWNSPTVWNTNEHNGSFYIGIGYTAGWYNLSTININQSGTGNHYGMKNVSGDNRTFDDKIPLSFAYHAGFFFNHRQDMAIEISYDPTVFHIVNNQDILFQGARNKVTVNEITLFSAAQGNYYRVAGGDILVNFVKKFRMYHNRMNTISVDFLAKGGVGPTVATRVQTGYYEKATDNATVQVTGWNAAVAAAFRATFFRNFYFEVAPNMDFATYRNLQTADGTASQNIIANNVKLSAGFTFASNRHNPLFRKVPRERRVVTIPENFIGEKIMDNHRTSNF